VRLERVTSPLEQAVRALRQAIQDARAAYMYVHYKLRKERLSRAINEFEGLFDKKAFSRRLKINFEDLAATTHELVHFDQSTGYVDYRHRSTIDLSPTADATGRLI
jgi:hypothetical protein